MGPRDRHSILKFIAFCQNNILRAAIFSPLEPAADVGPEQLCVGKGKWKAQTTRGARGDPQQPVPCPSQRPLPLQGSLGGEQVLVLKHPQWGLPEPGKNLGCVAGCPGTGRPLRSLSHGSVP